MKSAGSLESSDCLITVSYNKDKNNTVNIESIVFDQFGEQIFEVINKSLQELNIKNVNVLCQDKGALDYTIKARLATALKRLEGENNE
ncbi:citrate lyase acyl carrier protein [Candidatus Izimaplasma bacterium ZiA1]|uniref:citrate lyase acyl carrier protein n=1 Tax=Candidatus Izimoplasma sp. ZiA1 TaxID=2024899 RepID=UPI000BAA80F5|nr:citrate lyase acyl carrier protein [Candidatus Izimaplasma bacterium ZiA1]